MAAIRTPSKRSRFSSSVQRSFSAEAFREMPIDQWEKAQVALPHLLTQCGRLCPSYGDQCAGKGPRNLGVRRPNDESAPSIQIGFGPNVSSMLSLGTLPGIEIPETYPPCPSLRGQPCRPFEVSENTSVP